MVYFCFGLVLLLVACQSPETPTLTPVPPTPSPVSTPTQISTALPLPPTWTPQASPSALVGASSNEGAASPTPTFTPSLTPDISAICYILEPEESLNQASQTVYSGDPATIYWRPLPLPDYEYQVRLYHQDGTLLVEDITSASQFTFSPEVLVSFEAVYGWEITPIFNFQTACFPITGEIYVLPR